MLYLTEKNKLEKKKKNIQKMNIKIRNKNPATRKGVHAPGNETEMEKI